VNTDVEGTDISLGLRRVFSFSFRGAPLIPRLSRPRLSMKTDHLQNIGKNGTAIAAGASDAGRDHLIGEALHLLELRTALEQQKIHPSAGEFSHPLGDLIGRPRQAGS